ncbi:7834_t:CDS:2, partial [Cetraspora pellucida]
DLLRELNYKLVAEIAKLRKENTEIPELREKLLRFAEVEAENARLKQIIEENARRNAENAELKSRVGELEARLALLEQGSAVDGMMLSFGQTQNDEEKSNLIAKLDDTASYKMNSDNTPEQIENTSNNTSNSDVYQESNIQYPESLIRTESKSSKDKEIEFLDQVHKETVSIKIRERNQEKKLLQTNNTSISQAENLSSVNASKLPGDLEIYPSNHNQNSKSTILNNSNNEVIIKLDKNLIMEQELKQQLSTFIPTLIISDQIQDQDSSSYYFIEKNNKKINEIVISGVKGKTVTSMVYQEIKLLLPDITDSHVTSKIHLTNTYISLKAPQSKPTYDRSYFCSKTLDQYPNLYREGSNGNNDYYGITNKSLCTLCKLDHDDDNGIEGRYKIGSYYIKCEQRGIEIE